MSDEQNPFSDGKGLVGGRGRERAEHRPEASLVHRVVLNPYRNPEHMTGGREFFATGPVEVEIGFGRCHHLKDRILQARESRFLGFEIKRGWCERMTRFCDRNELDHTRIILGDARPLLSELLQVEGVAAFSVFFPDPWWKKRHHKRRIMSEVMLELMHQLLEPGGRIHFRTDVEEYFKVVEALIADHGGFDRIPPGLDSQGRTLPLTHREKKCAEYGIPVHTLCATKRVSGS